MKLSSNFIFSIFLLNCILIFSLQGKAQKVDTVSTFSITGYVDAYYAYYTDSVAPGGFQKFPTTSPRSNSPGLNIAQLAMQYASDKIRAVSVFHYGDIAKSTWAAPFTNIQQAYLGFRVHRKIWIDGGFFRTHFGTELLLPSENITSSVTVGTFHEPYYQSGIRADITATNKLEIIVYLLNGYNVFIDNNYKKSAGLAINYAVNDYMGIGYTNYIGDDSPPGTASSHLRFHENAFLNYQRNKVRLQVGGDFCLQKNADLATEKEMKSMFSALATARYQVANKLGIYVRGEVFQDPEGYMGGIITDKTGKQTGYKLWGVTAGAECKPTPESYVKLEGRMLKMDDAQTIFYNDGQAKSSRFEIMINAGVTFELLKRFGTRTAE